MKSKEVKMSIPFRSHAHTNKISLMKKQQDKTKQRTFSDHAGSLVIKSKLWIVNINRDTKNSSLFTRKEKKNFTKMVLDPSAPTII